ncbi:MAG: class I SAM-dependent methyltransferase [Nitrosopumilaceae archaeon]
MKPLSYYSEIIPFALKNKKIIEFINWKFEQKFDKIKQKRKDEYYKNMQDSHQILKKLFPDKEFRSDIFEKLENHLRRFEESKKNEKFPSKNNPYQHAGLNFQICQPLCNLIIFAKPNLVFETGVAFGISSSYILLGLDFLKQGKLISTDYIFFPFHSNETVGQAIPDYLKSRHELIVSHSKEELYNILKNTSDIDVFLHDSNHTYKHMMLEFRTAWPNIKDGGFLLSDNVHWNDAFLDFTDNVNKKPFITHEGFGIIKK